MPASTPYYLATTSRNNIQLDTSDRRLAWIGGLQWKSTTGFEVNFDVELSDYSFSETRQIFTLSETTRGMQNVVFGPDHPVTGGYPVVGVVVDADTDRLAQLRPGEELGFRWV